MIIMITINIITSVASVSTILTHIQRERETENLVSRMKLNMNWSSYIKETRILFNLFQ